MHEAYSEYAQKRLCEFAMLHGELNYLLSELRSKDQDYLDTHLPKLSALINRIKYCNDKIQKTYADIED